MTLQIVIVIQLLGVTFTLMTIKSYLSDQKKLLEEIRDGLKNKKEQ